VSTDQPPAAEVPDAPGASDAPDDRVRFRDDVSVELVKHSASDSDVLWAARVSTAGEQSLAELTKDPERSKGLINFLMRDRHGSPFEHNSMTFFVSAPIFVFREFMRHRVGWCLAGDTEITLESEGGSLRRRTIADLYRLWHHGAEDRMFREEHPSLRLRKLPSIRRNHVRCYDEETLQAQRAQIVDVTMSGVKALLRITTESGRTLRCSVDHAILTPDGWRKAGELAAGDAVMAAGTAQRPPAGLVPPSLRRGGKIAVAVPDRVVAVVEDGEEMTYDLSVAGPWHNFLADGIVVHNSYNEESGRYRELQPVFYVPGTDRKLVQQGRPGKYEFVHGTPEQHKATVAAMEESYAQSYAAYQEMLAAGVAREVARATLPVGLFSSMYATCNARSLMHFLGLRTQHELASVPSFPQREIEMVGERMEALWAELMPLTHAAFNANGRVAP
jgi:thymidylate synthase ThyX